MYTSEGTLFPLLIIVSTVKFFLILFFFLEQMAISEMPNTRNRMST